MQKPLTSLMAVGKAGVRTPRDLRGKRVGTSGIPYQSAYLKTILETAGVDPGSVKETNVGFNLVPAMLSGKVDATLGAFWNYEGVDLARRGRDPQIQRMEKLGVPTYAELVFVVRRRDLVGGVRREGAALHAGDRARARRAARRTRPAALDGLLAADKGLDRGLQEAAVKATLPVFFPDGRRARRSATRTRPSGSATSTGWSSEGLISERQNAEQAMTNEFLAGEGLDPRGALEQD